MLDLQLHCMAGEDRIDACCHNKGELAFPSAGRFKDPTEKNED
jgi:hypothetical protein